MKYYYAFKSPLLPIQMASLCHFVEQWRKNLKNDTKD